MKTNLLALPLLLVHFVLPSAAQASSDSLADLFPLAVGNQWEYDYKTSIFDELPDVDYADTGVVSYLITGSIVTRDSTRWQFREIRNLIHSYVSSGAEFPRADTSYAVRDTNEFEFVEFLTANHAIYRTAENGGADPSLSVFPFIPGYSDSTTVYRFGKVDSTDCLGIRARKTYAPYDSTVYEMDFKKNVGEQTVASRGGHTAIIAVSNHSLRGYTLTSVSQPPADRPQVDALYQNFPNPFNGSTEIRFLLPREEFTTIDLYDILGRKITTIFRGIASPGINTISVHAGVVVQRSLFLPSESRRI